MKVYLNEELDSKAHNQTTKLTIPPEGLVIQPNVLYLATTNEYTDTPNHVPLLADKSSIARLGISTHFNAGFGDLGFKGHWTLEITCTQPVRIYPDMKICQIFYLNSNTPDIPYNIKPSAKYLNQVEAQESLNYLNYEIKNTN